MEKMAYFDTSHEMPEEVLMAAGFIPYKILGDVHVSNEPADRYLPAFFCPAARSWLTEALASSKDWAGIVFAQGCNTTNRHIDVWRVHVKIPFLYWFNNPMNEGSAAIKFYRAELKKFIQKMEKHYSVRVTDEKLQEAIGQSNEVKRLMRELSALRPVKDISNREYFEAAAICVRLPKKEVIQKLNALLKDWSLRRPFPAGKKKILLTGSDVTYAEWMDILEGCGLRVVRDDLSIGERYFAKEIPPLPDPLDALIHYYQNIPRPATKPDIQKRIDFLLKSLEETEVDAVLSQNLKFCEPYAYDAVTVNNALKDKGYKLIHLEREFTPLADQQMVTRLSAFAEIL